MIAKAEEWRQLEIATRLKGNEGSNMALKIRTSQTSTEKRTLSKSVHAPNRGGSNVEAPEES